MPRDKFVFDPRDFIGPPYTICPFCSDAQFGVLSINETSYSRRCRKCLQSQVYSLPPLKKHIVYLDQFALSDMMKALNPAHRANKEGKVDPFWLKLYEKLDRLSKLQLVCFPESEGHHTESRLTRDHDPIKRIYEHLSQGAEFKDFQSIRAKQTHEALIEWLEGRPGSGKPVDRDRVLHGHPHGWKDRLLITVNSNWTSEFLDGVRRDRNNLHGFVKELFAEWQQQKGKAFEDWYEAERSNYGRNILSAFVKDTKRRCQLFASPEALADPFAILPNEASRLVSMIHDVFKSRGVPEDQRGTKANEFLMSNNIKETPYLRISAALWASLARKAADGQKQEPNAGTFEDFDIIASLLPYCDAMFIDSKCWAYFQDEPLKSMFEYKTKLFSLRNREAFLEYLEQIETTASKDHLQLVTEVYGPDWPTPYLTIFKDEVTESPKS